MSHLLFLQVLGYFVSFMAASLGYGFIVRRLLTWSSRQQTPPMTLEAAALQLLMGIGTVANLGLVLSLCGFFNMTSLLIVLVIGIATFLATLPRTGKHVRHGLQALLRDLWGDWLPGGLLVLTLVITGLLYLSAMQPPIATDELHYHLPQATRIAQTGHIAWALDGKPEFFTNIPKLMEVLFAEGLMLSGYSLAHAFNFAILFAFLLFIFAVLRRHYGFRSASFSVLLLVLCADFTWNGTVGFIDTATTCFEVTALILVGDYLFTKQEELLPQAGYLLGLALGAKYSPLPTAVCVSLLLLFFPRRVSLQKRLSRLLWLAIPALIAGGFWYGKNWLLFGNPFYPLYFGHRGMSDAYYLDIMRAIWQWEPKTLPTFLAKIARYRSPTEWTTYLALYLPFFTLFIRQRTKLTLILLGYYSLYVPYWFFLATHQIRFLLTGIVVALILSGIVLARVPRKLFLLGILLVIFYSLLFRSYPQRSYWQNYWWVKLATVERQYALGKISEREFLHREFGCAYDTIAFLNDQGNTKNVIDNWTLWEGPSTQYFARGYSYTDFPYGSVTNVEHLWQTIDERKIGYLYTRADYKTLSLSDTNEFMVAHVNDVLPAEPYLLKNATLVYEEGVCQLYRLDR